MLRKLINHFGTTLYVQIWEYRLKITNVQTLAVIDEKPLLQVDRPKHSATKNVAYGGCASAKSINPFSHPRTLLSDFYVAQKLLKHLFNRSIQRRFYTPSPCIVFHPMEKTEGGLTMIEERAFIELGLSAGANRVVVYVGHKLMPSQIDFNTLYKKHNTNQPQ